jgi:hypothetical protein
LFLAHLLRHCTGSALAVIPHLGVRISAAFDHQPWEEIVNGRTVVGVFAFLSLSSGTAALAQGKPEAGTPMRPPPVPKEMDQLKVFVGNWRCTGEAPGPEPGKMRRTTSENVIKSDFGGFWQAVKHHEAKSKDSPLDFTAQGWWGYDAASKQFTGLFADSYGAWEARSSKGWEGDTLVWRGNLHGFRGNLETAFKHTFTRKTDKEIAEKFEVNMEGKWTTLEENTCKKR